MGIRAGAFRETTLTQQTQLEAIVAHGPQYREDEEPALTIKTQNTMTNTAADQHQMEIPRSDTCGKLDVTTGR